MNSEEMFQLLTRVGPGTPGGEWMRRYWQPVALSYEVPPGSPPKPVRLLGEDLVLFRDEKARLGLLDRHCSHRGADLSYGRIEDGGLRCLYHGWLYDVQGACLHQPAEPEGGKFRKTIRHPAYPCQELGGLVFTYMGPGEPPQLPPYEALLAPDDHRFIKKYLIECNYLQGAEGDVDPSHLSILHTQFDAGEASPHHLYAKDRAPIIEIESTDFGMRIFTVRKISPEKNYVRVSYFVVPNVFVFPEASGLNGWTVNVDVPIDDTHYWKYQLTFSRDKRLDLEKLHSSFEADIMPDFHLKRNQKNRYLQDREEMKTRTFTGMGIRFGVHDAFASESPGSLRDWKREHLFSADSGLLMFRKILSSAIQQVQQGREPPRVPIDSETGTVPFVRVVSDFLPSSADFRESIK